jgi:RNase P/RNase MRP subunit p29
MRKKLNFRETKIVKEPVTVRFKTKSGQIVKIDATKIIRRPIQKSRKVKGKKKR